jgi:hypothetical protein
MKKAPYSHDVAQYDPIPKSTKERALADFIGTPAYQSVFAGHQPKTHVSKAHFATLVVPNHKPAFKSMPAHLGMLPSFGTKYAGL